MRFLGMNEMVSAVSWSEPATTCARPRTASRHGRRIAGNIARSFREHAYAFIEKPVHPEELLEPARNALASPAEHRAIQVISVSPDWVQLRCPCEMQSAIRVESMIEA